MPCEPCPQTNISEGRVTRNEWRASLPFSLPGRILPEPRRREDVRVLVSQPARRRQQASRWPGARPLPAGCERDASGMRACCQRDVTTGSRRGYDGVTMGLRRESGVFDHPPRTLGRHGPVKPRAGEEPHGVRHRRDASNRGAVPLLFRQRARESVTLSCGRLIYRQV